MNKKFTIEPSQSTWRELTGKFFSGLLIWAIISALLFIILSFIGSVFTESMWQTWEFVQSNPMLPLLLLLIWFISSFVWNLWVAGVYSLFFGNRYYNTSKTMWLLLLTNWILFVIFAPIYLIFNSDINTLFIILWFHIILSTFLSTNQMEVVANPNYSGSSIIGTTLWLSISILIYSIMRKAASIWGTQQKLYLMILIPPIIWFAIIPLWLWIREKIYYKMYENGSNGFFTPSLDQKTETEEIKDISEEEEEEINIELE